MFKKLTIILLSVLCAMNFGVTNAKPLFKGYADCYELYVHGNNNAVEIVSANDRLYPFINNVFGESFKMDIADFNLDEFLKNFDARLLFTERIEQGVSYYAYSPKIAYRQQVFGQTVNLHVFVGGQVTVGSPLIYGSF